MHTNNFTRPDEGQPAIQLVIQNDYAAAYDNFDNYFDKLSEHWYFLIDDGKTPDEIKEIDFDAETIRIPKGYALHRTVGYSQGDVAYILYKGGENKYINKMIDQLFWDTPVYIDLTIEGENFCTGDLLDNEYEYNKTEIVSKFEDPIVVQFLKDYLPENQDEI